MSSHYTTGPDGNPALLNPSPYSYRKTEELPYVLGNATVRRYADEIADSIISDARTVHGPVVWITGNAYMPPMRAITLAERVYQADNNRDGELWADLVAMVEDRLSEADVLMECPDYDNALYAVDLRRWQFKDSDGEHHPDFYESWDINDEWEPRDDSTEGNPPE